MNVVKADVPDKHLLSNHEITTVYTEITAYIFDGILLINGKLKHI